MAGTGNLILKRGTTIPFGGEDGGQDPVLLKGMPAVQLVGWSKTTDGSLTSGTSGPYAFDNYQNRLWIGQQGFGDGTSNTAAGIAEDFSVVGVQPYTTTAAQTVEFTRPMWMGAEIRAFTPVKKDNADTYFTILKADWDRPSDYVLCTQQAIAFAPQRIWATGTPQDTNGTPPPPALRRYIEWATVDHGNGTNDPWKTTTTHLSKKLVIPVATPGVGQTLVVATDGVNTVNGVDVVTLEWAQSGGGSTLTLNGDSGTASVADTTETITFTGGDGITTAVAQNSNTLNTVTISQNINELTAKTPVLADAIAINDSENSNAIKKSTLTDIRNLIRSNLDINSLTPVTTVTSDDQLIVEESSTVKKTTVGDLVDFIGSAANSDVAVSNTGQTTIGAGKVTNTMLATASASTSNNTVAIRDGSGNLVANEFTGPSTLVKGTATTSGTANKILFASSISSGNVTVAYDNNASPLIYDAANSKLIVQNLEVLGTEQVNTKISASVGAPYLTLNSDYSIYSGVSVGGVTGDGTSNSEPVENARVIVNRGPLSDTELRWNETTEKWELVTTKSYTNALTSIVKSTTAGLTINYAPTVGYNRKFQTGEYVSISGLINNKEYNNLWKVASSSYTNVTSASFTVTEKTVRHSQIVIAQNTPSSGRTQFTVTHDYTYAIPTGASTVTITGNTTSVLNNTYSGANVSSSTSTSLVFDVQTSSYTGLNGASGTNVASADTNHVTTTANGASAASVSTGIDCKLTGVWAYPLMYADGANTAENNTGEEQIIDKLTVRTLNMAGTWNLGSSITTDLNLGSGGLVLPQASSPPLVGSASDEGRIYWDTDGELLAVGTGTGAKTFVDTDSTQTLTGKSINIIGATSAGSNTTIHSQVTTGSIALGGGVTTGSITIGNALTSGTITIGNGNINSGTKTINIGTNGTSVGTTNINLGGSSTAGTTTINSPTLSVPNVTLVNLGSGATSASTINIGTASTLSGSTKAINIGTAGLSGSTTEIILGSAVSGASGTTTINSLTTTINSTTLSVPNATSITLGTTTAASTTNIGTGANASGTTKAINIGTAGLSGSTTEIILGSAVSGASGTTTINSTTLSASSATSVTLAGSTATSTVNIGTGATVSGASKTLNIGTAGVSGSTTDINLGSAVAGASGTTTINGVTTTISSPTFSASSATSITLGNTTAASTTNIGTGVNTSGTKAINIGTGGGANGTTTVTIGSCAASHTSNVYLGSSAGTSVVQVSNNALIFKDTGTNRITLSSASTIGAAATHTLPNITSGNVVIASATDFNTSNYILMGASSSTSPSVFTNKDTVVVGGVRVNMQNTIASNVRYPIPFLGSNRSTGATDPAAGFSFAEGAYQDSYLYANMAAAGTATGAPTNYTNGLFYEVNDASDSNVGTLFCDYIGATLDCGSY